MSNPTLKTDFGKLSYIHKVKDDQHIYYFANSSDEEIETEVVLKGDFKLELWNPLTGETIKKIPSEATTKEDQNFTRIELKLNPVESLFLMER